jgi:hypothetical protein
MKLKDWAEKAGVKYLTAYRWFKAGTLPVKAYQTNSGTIIVEDEFMESPAASSANNDAMSLFLKKTVEFSKNNSTVEDFAAYVISNFQLKISNTTDGPKYSKQKPKPEDVQKHFQQFIPKGEKPKTNSFIMEPEAFGEIPGAQDPTPPLQSAIEFSLAVDPQNYAASTSAFANTPNSVAGAMSPTESTVTRSVDLNTTPQSINYTGSNNLAFSGSSTLVPTTFVSLNHTNAFGGTMESALYFNDVSDDTSLVGSFHPTQKELQSVQTSADIRLNQPRNKRGRKPNKR